MKISTQVLLHKSFKEISHCSAGMESRYPKSQRQHLIEVQYFGKHRFDNYWGLSCSGKLSDSSAETRLPLASLATSSSSSSLIDKRYKSLLTQMLKLWGGGGHHDVPEGFFHRSSRSNEKRVSCWWSCWTMRGLPPGTYIYVAKTEDCLNFFHQRFGSTASALNWKVRSQPKHKACCSRGSRVWSRFDKSKKLG